MDLDTLVGSVRKPPMNLGGYDLIAPDDQQLPSDEEIQTEWRRRQAEEGRLLRQSESLKAVADNPVDRLFSVGQDAWADVLKQARTESLGKQLQSVPAIVREPMLGVAQSGAQVFGTALRPLSPEASRAVSDYGEMTSQAAEEASVNDWFPKAGRIGRGAVSSLTSAGVMSPLGAGMAAGFGAMEYTDALREAEEAGLTEADQSRYARDRGLIEAGISLVFSGASKAFKLPALAGLEGRAFSQEVAKRTLKDHGLTLVKTTAGELPEEVLTEIGHNLARQRIDPRAGDWDKQIQTAADTVAQTLVTMGLAEGTSLAGSALSKDKQPPGEQLEIPPVSITDTTAQSAEKPDLKSIDVREWIAANPEKAQRLVEARDAGKLNRAAWTEAGIGWDQVTATAKDRDRFAKNVAKTLREPPPVPPAEEAVSEPTVIPTPPVVQPPDEALAPTDARQAAIDEELAAGEAQGRIRPAPGPPDVSAGRTPAIAVEDTDVVALTAQPTRGIDAAEVEQEAPVTEAVSSQPPPAVGAVQNEPSPAPTAFPQGVPDAQVSDQTPQTAVGGEGLQQSGSETAAAGVRGEVLPQAQKVVRPTVTKRSRWPALDDSGTPLVNDAGVPIVHQVTNVKDGKVFFGGQSKPLDEFLATHADPVVAKSKPTKRRTLRQAVREMGGIRQNQDTGRKLPNPLRFLINKNARFTLDEIAADLVDAGEMTVPSNRNPSDYLLDQLLLNSDSNQNDWDRIGAENVAAEERAYEDAKQRASTSQLEEIRSVSEAQGVQQAIAGFAEGHYEPISDTYDDGWPGEGSFSFGELKDADVQPSDTQATAVPAGTPEAVEPQRRVDKPEKKPGKPKSKKTASILKKMQDVARQEADEGTPQFQSPAAAASDGSMIELITDAVDSVVEDGTHRFSEFVNTVLDALGSQTISKHAKSLAGAWSEKGRKDSRLDKPTSLDAIVKAWEETQERRDYSPENLAWSMNIPVERAQVIDAVLRKMKFPVERIVLGRNGPLSGAELLQPAFHGSPHRFDKFSTDKIGTGEGAQSYGWGLYFAGSQAVAKYYKERLTAKHDIGRFDGLLDELRAIEYKTDTPARMRGRQDTSYWVVISLKAHMGRGMTYGEAVEKEIAESEAANEPVSPGMQQSLRSYTPPDAKSGAGYVVDLKPAADEYLDWDKPLSQQSDKVKAALKKLGNRIVSQEDVAKARRKWEASKDPKDLSLLRDAEGEASLTGGNIYEGLRRGKGGDRSASEKLKSLGIRGNKYLDQGSRSQGEGSYNYVIFDDADVEITALFQGGKNPKGAAQLLEGGKVLIRGFEASDESTAMHEIWHAIEMLLLDPNVPAEFREGITAEDIATYRKWTGLNTATDAESKRKAHEKGARGWERYLREGAEPKDASPELKSLFARVKEWLVDIYKTLRGLPNLNEDIRKFFDRMVTRGERLEANARKPAEPPEPSSDPEKPKKSPAPPESRKKPQKRKSRRTWKLTDKQRDFLRTNETALAMQKGDQERKVLGLPPVLPSIRRRFPDTWQQVLANVDRNPLLGDQVLADLDASGRRPLDEEGLILLYTLTDAQNKWADLSQQLSDAENSGDQVTAGWLQGMVDDAEDRFLRIRDVAKKAGADRGRGLAVWAQLAKQDFTLGGMLRARTNANDGKLSEEQIEQTKAAQKEIQDIQNERDGIAAEAEKEEIEQGTKERIAAVKDRVAKDRTRASKGVKAQAEIAEADKQIEDVLAAIRKIPGMKFSLEAAAGTLAYELTRLAKAYAVKGVAHGKAFLSAVNSQLGSKFATTYQSEIMQAWKQYRLDNPLKLDGAFTGEDLLHLQRSVDGMVYSLVESGVEEPDAVVKAVFAELKPYIPGLTARKTQEIISGYGPYKPQSKTDLDEKVSRLKSILLLMSKLDTITQDKQVPYVKGGKRRKPTQAERDLRKQIDQLLKSEGLIATDPAVQSETLISTAMTVLRNQIEQMDADLERGYAIVNKKKVRLDDEALDALRAERDNLKRDWLGLFTKEHLEKLIADVTKQLQSDTLSSDQRTKLTQRLEDHQAEWNKRYKERTMSERVEDAKRNAEARMDSVVEQIRLRKRIAKATNPLQPDQELQRLLDEEKALNELLDKYLPEDSSPYSSEQAIANKERQLEREIQQINNEIRTGRRREDATSKDELDSPYIQSLVRVRDARIELRDSLFPKPANEQLPLTIEERLRRAEAAVDRSILKATKERDALILANITGSIPATRKDVQGPKPSNAAIARKTEELNELRRQKKQLRETINPDEALIRRKTRELNRLNDNLAALAEGTYQPKKKLERTWGKKLEEVDSRLALARTKWRHELRKDRDANRHKIDQTLDGLNQWLRLAKDWKTGWSDLGYLLLQGGKPLAGHPVETFSDFVKALKVTIANEDGKALDKAHRSIAADPDFKSGVLRKMGFVFNPDAEALSREEESVQSRILQIPGVKVLARRANNGMSAFLTWVRFKRYKGVLAAFQRRGGHAGDRELAALGAIQDMWQGRGAMSQQTRTFLQQKLGWLAFAPQWGLSQIQNAIQYDVYLAWKSGGGLPMYRTLAAEKIRQTVGLLVIQSVLTALYNALGDDDDPKAEFVLDPLDKEFLATSIDNGTLNISLAAEARLLALLLQQVFGRRVKDVDEKKSFSQWVWKTGGRTAPVGQRGQDAWDAVAEWARGRLGVIPSVGLKLLAKKDQAGNPYGFWPSESLGQLKAPGGLIGEAMPISIGTTLNVAGLEGPNVKQKTFASVLGFFGANISTRSDNRHIRNATALERDYEALRTIEKMERLAGNTANADALREELRTRYEDHVVGLSMKERNDERNKLRGKPNKTDKEQRRLVELNTELAAEAKQYLEQRELPTPALHDLVLKAASRSSRDRRTSLSDEPLDPANDLEIEFADLALRERFPNVEARLALWRKAYDAQRDESNAKRRKKAEALGEVAQDEKPSLTSIRNANSRLTDDSRWLKSAK